MNWKKFSFFVLFIVAISSSANALQMMDWIRNQSSGGGGTTTEIIGGDSIFNTYNSTYGRAEGDDDLNIHTSTITFNQNYCNARDWSPGTDCSESWISLPSWLTFSWDNSSGNIIASICWLYGNCVDQTFNTTNTYNTSVDVEAVENSTLNFNDNSSDYGAFLGDSLYFGDYLNFSIWDIVAAGNESMKAWMNSNPNNYLTSAPWHTHYALWGKALAVTTANATNVYPTGCGGTGDCMGIPETGYIDPVAQNGDLDATCDISGYVQSGNLAIGIDNAGIIDYFVNTTISGIATPIKIHGAPGKVITINAHSQFAPVYMRESGTFAATCGFDLLVTQS